MEFSKRLISDIHALLWVVTVGGLLLAAYCVRADYVGALPRLSAMVGLLGLNWSKSTGLTHKYHFLRMEKMVEQFRGATKLKTTPVRWRFHCFNRVNDTPNVGNSDMGCYHIVLKNDTGILIIV